MAKSSRYSRSALQSPKSTNTVLQVLKGALISLLASVIFVLLLVGFSLLQEDMTLDRYLQYVMIMIALLSIFIGSAWASHQTQSQGLLVGVSVGILYSLLSMLIGIELNPSTLSVSILLAKLAAALAAGALGGLVGLNL